MADSGRPNLHSVRGRDSTNRAAGTSQDDRATPADCWAVFEDAPDAYLLLAADPPRFTMVAANAARLRATMTRREDVVGRPLFEVFPDNPADSEATGVKNLRASLERVLRTKASHRMARQKYDIRGPSGEFEERYWEPLNAPVFDARHEVIYIIHRVEDVTEQVRSGQRLSNLESTVASQAEARREIDAMMAKLRGSEERYRLLVDMVPQFIWATDPAGHHTFFSRRWYEYSGATLEQSRGEGWVEFMHPDDRARALARWQHSLTTGEAYEIEYRFRAADGSYHWFLGKALPLRNDRGEIVEWFGTATDISERKRLDEQREALLGSEREAHEQVTTILESITDAFFAVDREWRFEYLNHEAERLLRRTREQLLGHSVWNEFGEAVGSVFEREYRRAMTEKTAVNFEAFYPPLDIWVDVRAYPSAGGLSVFFRDVSARKRAQEQLRESEERYRLLADMIPQQIWTTDSNGANSYFSRRWYEFTGATLEQTEGDRWLEFLHPDDRPRATDGWRVSVRTGDRYSIEYRVRKHTGEYCWFWAQAVPQRNESGAIVRWVGTLTEITERKRRDEERERLLANERSARTEAERRREEVERVTESRTRLIRGFTHDVKNPLGAADGYAQLLQDGILGELSERQLDGIGRIRKSIRSSLNLIQDLLELAKTEAGLLELERANVDAAEMARETVEDFRAQATAAGLALEVRAPEHLFVHTDASRARQILSNLLSNAVKYTASGRITVEAMPPVQAASHRRDACVAIAVTDTGPGIPAEKCDAVFQEFTRLDPAAQQGAGVGLAISRRVARLLGGDITLDSVVGRGSTFTLWLPCAMPPKQ